MKNSYVNFIAAKDCPYKFNGQNLVELRRARLRKIALALNVPADGPKNDILIALIGRLKASGAPEELSEYKNG